MDINLRLCQVCKIARPSWDFRKTSGEEGVCDFCKNYKSRKKFLPFPGILDAFNKGYTPRQLYKLDVISSKQFSWMQNRYTEFYVPKP